MRLLPGSLRQPRLSGVIDATLYPALLLLHARRGAVNAYEDLLARKEPSAPTAGFAATVEEPWLYPFQRHAVTWALAGGRRALFEDTGLGKTRQELAWADRVARHAGGRVLLFAPLAVGAQTVQEAEAVGLDGVVFARSPDAAGTAPIVVTNYDNLDKWSPDDFAGIVLDESSILKSFMGSTRAALTAFASGIPYRLAATATPSPNDVEELGTHAEWLGMGSRVEMLSRFFVNDSSDTGTWVLKGHAIGPFWDWVASWALSARLPSDVGPYDDEGYILPPLRLFPCVVMGDLAEGRADGMLFAFGGVSATSIHETKRRSTAARAAKAAEIIAREPGEPWIVWCETQYEADAVMAMIPGAFEVSGSMPPDTKSSRLLAFADGRPGSILVTKPKIAGFGLNYQRCARVLFVGGSYSYEAFYQAVRRCWRFGQTRPVDVHVLMGFSEQVLWQTVTGKSDRHADMREQMIRASRRSHGRAAMLHTYNPDHAGSLPAWLTPSEEP